MNEKALKRHTVVPVGRCQFCGCVYSLLIFTFIVISTSSHCEVAVELKITESTHTGEAIE